MNAILSQIFPILYGVCFLLLLWQAFKVLGQGFQAVPRPGDSQAASSRPEANDSRAGDNRDRTGRLTIHPELLDDEGRITDEDLLTVRFSGDNERPAFPGDAS
jgi:hypothetical protein